MKIAIDRHRESPRGSSTGKIGQKIGQSKARAAKKKARDADLVPAAPKSKSRAVVTTDKKLTKIAKQTQLLAKTTSSTFGIPARQLYTMIQDGQVDQAIITFQRQILATLLRLIPIAERQYRKEKKEHTAYALNSLISQARELTADIQSSADRAQVAEVIVSDMLMPTFRSFIETLVVESQTLKGVMDSKVKPSAKAEVDVAIDSLVRQVARTGNELFRNNANSIRDLLGAPKKRGVR